MLKIEGLYFYLIESFGVCLHINCLVTERPKHFQFQTHFYFFNSTVGLIGSGLGRMIFHKMSPRAHHNYL